MDKQQLTENEEWEVSTTTMLIFLALIAGVMLGYAWCWYQYYLGG